MRDLSSGESHTKFFCWSDYAEQIVYIFYHQIKSEYYDGNIYVSIEDTTLEYLSDFKQPITLLASGNVSNHALLHSFFSDDRKEYSDNTAVHSFKKLNYFKTYNFFLRI